MIETDGERGPGPPPARSVRERLERFERRGLAWNPFRVLAPGEIESRRVDREPRVADLLDSSRWVVLGVGPEGRGKSTLLGGIGAGLVERGIACHRVWLPPGHGGAFPEPPEGSIALLLDEAERLGARGRERARRWAAGPGRRLIATAHADVSADLGEDVEVVVAPGLDVDRVQAFFRRRIEFAGGDPGRFDLTEEAARELVEEAGGSSRACTSASRGGDGVYASTPGGTRGKTASTLGSWRPGRSRRAVAVQTIET